MTARLAPAVVGLGEALIRLSAPELETLDHARSLDLFVGGAELNVLTALAAQGQAVRYITRLADDPLARRISRDARADGLELCAESAPGTRTPLYFVEPGVPPRPSKVFYDRSGSAMRDLRPDSFDWAAVLTGARVAVAGGITSALGRSPDEANAAFLAAATAAGITTAFDVNHRAQMWTWDDCRDATLRLLPSVDILFGSGRDLAGLLGRDAADTNPDRRTADARAAIERFGLTTVVLRDNADLGTDGVEVTATVVTAAQEVISRPAAARVIDPFGAGDAGLALFLDSFLRGLDLQAVADRTALASALQHTTPGDRWILGPLPDLDGDRRRVRR
ncbi:MAG: sugar kinase [bacterium]